MEIAAAWIVRMEGFGPLGGLVDGIRVTPARVESGRVFVADDVHVPFDPMVGCIGVAPSRGAASTLRPVYPTGGNLDLRELSPGSVLWLPVAVAGALLSVGDLHAAMGRGEPAFIAIEGSGTATLRIDIEQRSKLTLPRIRTAEGTVVVGMGESFPSARQSAVEQAYAVLTDDHGLPPEAAYAYVCARVELRFAGLSGSMVEGMEAVAALVPDPHQREATDSQPVPQTRVHGAHCDRRPLQWLSLSVPAASRLAPRSRCQCWPAARHSGQSELVEAVAQTVKMRSGVRPGVRSKLLRVGSEIGHRIRQATPVRVDAVAPSPSDAHLSERAAAFPRRLYATASMESDSGPRP